MIRSAVLGLFVALLVSMPSASLAGAFNADGFNGAAASGGGGGGGAAASYTYTEITGEHTIVSTRDPNSLIKVAFAYAAGEWSVDHQNDSGTYPDGMVDSGRIYFAADVIPGFAEAADISNGGDGSSGVLMIRIRPTNNWPKDAFLWAGLQQGLTDLSSGYVATSPGIYMSGATPPWYRPTAVHSSSQQTLSLNGMDDYTEVDGLYGVINFFDGVETTTNSKLTTSTIKPVTKTVPGGVSAYMTTAAGISGSNNLYFVIGIGAVTATDQGQNTMKFTVEAAWLPISDLLD